jgi:hypothetical protein
MSQATSPIRDLLQVLYAQDSKHAHYQTLPEPLAHGLGLNFEINEEWRGDRTRYRSILEWIPDEDGLRILDVGANTGFFSLSLAHDRPRARITACEPNPTHARIIRLLASSGGYTNLATTEMPASIARLEAFAPQDLVLHLNILHHAGHDFDCGEADSPEAFAGYGIRYLARLAGRTPRLVFQMGYNWGGNKTLPLVGRDDQAGKVFFTRMLLERAGWSVEAVAFARAGNPSEPIGYERFDPAGIPAAREPLQSWLAERYGSRVWSEFYQRPIWFCRNRDGAWRAS